MKVQILTITKISDMANVLSWISKLLAYLTVLAVGLVKFVRKWHELISIPIAVVLWIFSPIFLRWIDPTAATFDAGVLQKILFAVIALFVCNGVVWLLIKLTFPRAYKFLDDKFEMLLGNHAYQREELSDKEKSYYLTSFQKCVLVLALYISLCLCFVLLVISL